MSGIRVSQLHRHLPLKRTPPFETSKLKVSLSILIILRSEAPGKDRAVCERQGEFAEWVPPSETGDSVSSSSFVVHVSSYSVNFKMWPDLKIALTF